MAKQKIRDIIDRELIIRTNNVNYTQEYGVAGENANIYVERGKTIFLTSLGIHEISFVTVNGVTQALGRDYEVLDAFRIRFNGVVMDGRTVVIGYFYDKIRSSEVEFPPVLTFFTSDNTEGKDGIIRFFFNILPNSGRNIYWSIHKDGEDVPAKNTSGEELTGTSLNVLGVDGAKAIEYEITYQEYLDRPGQTVPFTLIVVYDLSEDPGADEKLMGTVTYAIDGVTGSVLSINIEPSGTITTPKTDKDFEVTYNIDLGSFVPMTWELIGPYGTILDSGDDTDLPADRTLPVMHSFTYGDPSLTYTLKVIENGGTLVKTDVISVNIPVPVMDAQMGWYCLEKLPAGNDFNSEISRDEFIARATGQVADPSDVAFDYFTDKNFSKPAIGSISNANLLEISPKVTSDLAEEGSWSNMVFIAKIPTEWGMVQIQNTGGSAIGGYPREGYIVIPGEIYSYLVGTDGYAFEFDFTIKRI